MRKQYSTPMLTVDSINQYDVIATSIGINQSIHGNTGSNANGGLGFAPERNSIWEEK